MRFDGEGSVAALDEGEDAVGEEESVLLEEALLGGKWLDVGDDGEGFVGLVRAEEDVGEGAGGFGEEIRVGGGGEVDGFAGEGDGLGKGVRGEGEEAGAKGKDLDGVPGGPVRAGKGEDGGLAIHKFGPCSGDIYGRNAFRVTSILDGPHDPRQEVNKVPVSALSLCSLDCFMKCDE